MSRGRHRRTFWGRLSHRWKYRRKMPESFPIVGLLFAFLIGICAVGFILSPSSPETPPDTRTPYSSSPSEEKGSGTDRVTPEPNNPNDPSECIGLPEPLPEICL